MILKQLYFSTSLLIPWHYLSQIEANNLNRNQRSFFTMHANERKYLLLVLDIQPLLFIYLHFNSEHLLQIDFYTMRTILLSLRLGTDWFLTSIQKRTIRNTFTIPRLLRRQHFFLLIGTVFGRINVLIRLSIGYFKEISQ